MPRNDASIPSETRRLIHQEASSQCTFCTERTIKLLQIHHIVPRERGGSNEPANLILVCRNCHGRIEAGEITDTEIGQAKARFRILPFPSRLQAQDNNSIAFTHSTVNNSFVANRIVVQTSGRKMPPVSPPLNSIGADARLWGHIDYLIKRYHQFRRADQSFGVTAQYEGAVIWVAIQREFKSRPQLLSTERFDELVSFLRNRIDNTRLGRRNRASGISNYSVIPSD